MIEIFRLVVFCLLTVIFGIALLSLIKSEIRISYLCVYSTVGIVAIAFISFLLRLVGVDFALINLFVLFSSVCILFFKKPRLTVGRSSVIIIFLQFAISLLLITNIFFEGYAPNGDLIILGEQVHDGLWHVALQEAVKIKIPPNNPIFSGQNIRGYHYLTDLYFANVALFSGFSTVSIYLIFAPLLLAFLYVGSLWTLLISIFKEYRLAFFTLLITLFSSGFAYLAPVFFVNAAANQSVFWLDQPIKFLINQQLVLSLAITNIVFWLLIKKKNLYLIGFLIGVTAGIKVYGFIILLLSIGFLGLYHVIKKTDTSYLKISIVAFFIGIIIVFLGGGNQGFPFILKPGWFIQTMFASADRLAVPNLDVTSKINFSVNTIPVLTMFWIIGLGIFLIGNFGVKILGLFFILTQSLVDSKKKNLLISNDILVMFLIIIFWSITLPLIFVQKGVLWNTIQFMHYAQVPLVILFVVSLTKFLSSKKIIVILLVVLLIGIPTPILAVYKNFSVKSYHTFSKEVVNIMEFLSTLPSSKKIVIGSYFYETSLVPALAKREVLFADPIILSILNIDFSQRKKYINDMEKMVSHCQRDEIYVLHLADKIATGSGKIIYETNHTGYVIECLPKN